jgi:hypothetical protein
MKRALTFSAVVGVAGTWVAVAIFYTDYGELTQGYERAFTSVLAWPLLEMALALTAMSVLVPFALHYFKEASDPEQGLMSYAFALLWLWFPCFYPGKTVLGHASPGAAFAAFFLVCLAQYVAAHCVLKHLQLEELRRAA